jgi:hypothetical protein
LHDSKHDLPRISTDDGITIDVNPEPENADASIRFNLEPFSNRIDSSDLHPRKHDLQKISIDDGIISFWHFPKHRTSDRSDISYTR